MCDSGLAVFVRIAYRLAVCSPACRRLSPIRICQLHQLKAVALIDTEALLSYRFSTRIKTSYAVPCFAVLPVNTRTELVVTEAYRCMHSSALLLEWRTNSYAMHIVARRWLAWLYNQRRVPVS